jgi:probable LLM family oxidoreductase
MGSSVQVVDCPSGQSSRRRPVVAAIIGHPGLGLFALTTEDLPDDGRAASQATGQVTGPATTPRSGPADRGAMELGIYSFADVPPAAGGVPGDPGRRLRELVEQAALADQVGLDVVGVGEHHRPEYASSAPAVVLAAIAERTVRIRLSSAVTVLSSDDPVRVYQQFATLDLLSGGRAEIMVGRGSFIESFPLFGLDLDDYDDLFTDKLDLLLSARDDERVTWSGRHRPAVTDRGVYPRAQQSPLPVWVAVGGTPRSVARAGLLGLPLALAVLGGQPAEFAPFLDLYRQAARQGNHDPSAIPVGVNLHGFVADTSQAAADMLFPAYQRAMSAIGRERGFGPLGRADFDAGRAPGGHLLVGSPAEVTERILAIHEALGQQRLLLQLDVGGLPHRDLMRSIELFGNEVAPAVQTAVSEDTPAVSPRG